MLEIAAELGVTESRVSQLRAEALILLRDGLNAHLDPDTLPAEPRPDGRLAKRRAAYHAVIAACSDSGPGSTRPRGPCSSGSPRRVAGTRLGLNRRSDNRFACQGSRRITFL